MDKKLFVVPDVHGRDFWKQVKGCIKSNPSCTIVFLGDYLDPYFPEGIDFPTALENFKEIIAFKKENTDNVVLLIGNHDIHYLEGDYGCSRYNRTFAPKAKQLFEENADLFQLAYLFRDGSGRKVLCTHAGVSESWVLRNYTKEQFKTPEKCVEKLNQIYQDRSQHPVISTALVEYGIMRGGWSVDGGPLWCDFREIRPISWWKTDTLQVYGHTQMINTGMTIPAYHTASSGYVFAGICCDSRAVFEYDESSPNKLTALE